MENRQIVVFKLMGHEFGLDIMQVLEIINHEWIRPVPSVPDYIEGIINVRSTVYPIFNLRKRLHMTPIDDLKETKIILLNLEQSRVGLLVDSVSEILSVQEEHIERTPEIINKDKASCIDYIVKQADRIIITLDVAAVISEAESLFIEGVSNEEDYCSNRK